MKGLLAAAALSALLVLPTVGGVAWASPRISSSRVFGGLRAELIEILSSLRETALEMGRILSGTLIVVGVVLWASDVFSYKGRRLITSGVILYFILELLS